MNTRDFCLVLSSYLTSSLIIREVVGKLMNFTGDVKPGKVADLDQGMENTVME